MEGFLWLLIQMALLLLAAAVVFFLLGWRWRGQNATRDIQALNARIDADSTEHRTLQDQRDAAISNDQMLRATQLKIEADLQEANDHRRNLERELIRGHDDLKDAKRDAQQRAEDLAAALSQNSTLQQQVEQLQKETAAPRPQPSVPSVTSTEPAPEKPKRIRKPAAPSAKVPKSAADVQATITRLETDISAQQTLLSALRQEHDDWQKRVSRLREKANDPAGLGLATKSLQRSEAQVAEAQTRLESLQRQNHTLHHTLEQAASITQDDDLTKIKGIKSVLSTQLHAYGIRTFRQIADWTDADVEAFSELLSFKDRARRDHWVQQARDLL